jgi:drug/metabolite transporter (DMT)-like permease|tara:strand:+ start:174 stop:1106 length:933 start_codon:yes stop_codon:yes gene_type:complete
MQNIRKATMALFGVTLLWGGTFIWMQQSLDAAAHSAPGLDEKDVAIFFVMMRFVIAGLFLLIFVPKTWHGLKDREVWRGGVVLGVIVWGGFILQMLGLTDVTPAVSAFLTSLYVVFTALIGVALGMQKLTRFAVLGVLLATFGAGWISGPPQLNFGVGEWLTVGCAFLFGAHIIATDRITKVVDPIQVTATMLLTVATLSIVVYMVVSREFTNEFFSLMKDVEFTFPLMLCAILGSLVALLVLNMFQKQVTPVRAAILYALEPVWAMLGSLMLGLEGEVTFWLPLGAAALLIGNIVVEYEQISRIGDESE